MTMAIQQLYVQQETLATILQEARNKFVGQVQNATSTTSHEEPMKRADRLFKLRLYLGAVDQRNELEPETTEESSTPRLTQHGAQFTAVLSRIALLPALGPSVRSDRIPLARSFSLVLHWDFA